MDNELDIAIRKIVNKEISHKLLEIAQYIKQKEDAEIEYLKKIDSLNNDTKIQKIMYEVDSMRKNDKSIGEFVGNEKERYLEFVKTHYASCGGHTEIRIQGAGGIGRLIKCCCLKCGNIEDITDTSKW